MIPEHLIPKDFNFSPGVPTNPAFLYADFVSHNEVMIAASNARSNSLVKAPKSQTREFNKENEFEYAYKRHTALFKQQLDKHCMQEKNAHIEFEHARTKTKKDALGCKAVIEYRDWQDAWRLRTEVETTSGSAPPLQSGYRVSDMLTPRAATKIADSCEFMQLKKGGFKTFVTGTLSEESRKKLTRKIIKKKDVQINKEAVGDIEANAPFTPITFELETTIQKEVTRTMDALQKMYKRGWQKESGKKVAGHDEGLPYLWVVEVPENEKGEPNPHIHMLLGWRVEYENFSEWSKRIESIWSHGYFHLEKIKDSACAGAYMAKAAGYLCKAQGKTDQGTVTGNRYSISKTARAPAWLQVSRRQIDTIGQLIYDVYDHLSVKYGEKYRERKALNNALSSVKKENKNARANIGKRLAKVRKEINKIPVRCNKYQLIVKGSENAKALLKWLKAPTGSEQKKTSVDWLPEKPKGWEWSAGRKPKPENTHYFSKMYKKFAEQKFWRRLKLPFWLAELNGEIRRSCLSELDYWANAQEKEQDFCLSEYYALTH